MRSLEIIISNIRLNETRFIIKGLTSVGVNPFHNKFDVEDIRSVNLEACVDVGTHDEYLFLHVASDDKQQKRRSPL